MVRLWAQKHKGRIKGWESQTARGMASRHQLRLVMPRAQRQHLWGEHKQPPGTCTTESQLPLQPLATRIIEPHLT